MSEENIREDMSRPDIAAELRAMLDIDQELRDNNLKDGDFWDDEIEGKNTQRMKEMIAEIGFPTISMVGQEGMQNAWLLIQHADRDIEFQKMCLNLMKSLNPSNVDERHLRHVAYLEDRIRVNQKLPQIYGTQFHQINGEHVPEPIEDEVNLEKRRAEMGLGTMDEQIKMMYRKYPKKSDGTL